MDKHFVNVAEAFTRKAQLYDDFGQGHDNLIHMRDKVREHVLACLKPGDRILELNAGTGADAVYFARHGYKIHATDISPGMIAKIEEKIIHFGLQDKMSAQQVSFTELEEVTGGPYQHIFSNLGGVNCIDDLTLITNRLPGLLVPGGDVTWVVMPPICLWEMTSIFKGNFKTAFRRMSPHGTLATVEGVQFMTYYYPPHKVINAFGEDFRLLGIQGLSVFTPTADVKGFPQKHPRLYKISRFLDDHLADVAPFNGWGDFYILTLKYLPKSYES